MKKQLTAKAEAAQFRSEVALSGRGGRGQSAGRVDGVVDKKLDLMSCKGFAPPHSVVFHDPTTHRIRGYFCLDKKRPSRGCLLAHGQNVACRVVLTRPFQMLQCLTLFLCLMMSLPMVVQLPLLLFHLLGAGLLHQLQLPEQLLHLLLVLRLHLELGLQVWRALWGVVSQLTRSPREC